MENIIVEIPCIGHFDRDIYVDPCNCYLAQALKKAGYKEVSIGPVGRTSIGRNKYVPKEKFGYNTLKNAFAEQSTLIVELIPN